MGREIEKILLERGHEIVLRIDAENASELTPERLAAADVALEFTMPETAYANIRACILARTPVVSGTTGWTARLGELEKLEKAGATFPNKQQQDVRIRYVAPIVVAAGMVVTLAAVIGLFLWAFNEDPSAAPPMVLIVALIAIPALLICGVLFALFQRIREIGKGEIDDAKKY